jgi:hypothetical protein
MTVSYEWRGSFENAEVNALHAEAFAAGSHSDDERQWVDLVAHHGTGWVVARDSRP